MHLLILDDHALFRAGVRLLLGKWRQDVEIDEAETLAAAIDLIKTGRTPDLVLVDLMLGAEPDMDVITKVREAAPGATVVVVSMADERNFVRQALERGARGFISKAQSGDKLLAALDTVLSGGLPLPTSAWRQDEEDNLGLSPRQREVLRLVASGLSNREISLRLDIAEPTVKVHVHKILKLLNVTSRAKAMVIARENGLL
jgi:DNA-binding NarL/FixJ family response regulator